MPTIAGLTNRLRQLALRRLTPLSKERRLLRLGSEYGGWTVPTEILDAQSICYCAGVGEDASFDLALIRQSGCVVHAFDPTPRAIRYSEAIQAEEPNFVFHPYGLWSDDTSLRFYAPKDSRFVSHSAVNLQGTSTYFEAPVRSLQSIMRQLGHDHIDLLKMDIEGAEHIVLDSMRSAKILPRILCIEFDQPCSISKIRRQVRDLHHRGYSTVAVDGWNFTFVR